VSPRFHQLASFLHALLSPTTNLPAGNSCHSSSAPTYQCATASNGEEALPALPGNQWAAGPNLAHVTNHFNELAIAELATYKECAWICAPDSSKSTPTG